MCVFNAFLLEGNKGGGVGLRGLLKKSRQCSGKVVLNAFLAMKAAQRAGGSR